MVSRRPHRKSRLGCRCCKTRRVKCDEIRPVCGNCLRHSIACDFFSSDALGRTQSLERVRIPRLQEGHQSRDVPQGTTACASSFVSTSRAPSDPSTTSGYPSPILISTPADRLLEFRLFHHFTKMTTNHFPSPCTQNRQALDQHTWLVWITDLAVHTPTLMDALLGFSAFHLRNLDPSDRSMYQASHRYMARAISSHARELQEGIDKNSAEGLLATSILIALHVLASQRILESDENVKLPLHWFRSYDGIQAVLHVAWPWLQNSDIRRLIRWPKVSEDPLTESQTKPFTFLLDGLEAEEGLDAATREAYESSVAYLSRIHSSTEPRESFRFPASVSPRFIELLEAQDPRTLAILGYYFMLLKRFNQVWWMRGTLEREFKAVMSFLPKEWWPRMDRALKEFNWIESPEC